MSFAVKVKCRYCGSVEHISMSMHGYDKWKGGEMIQDALPDLSPEQREMLISQTCANCWDSLFKDDEPEENERELPEEEP
jgi:hypothetical protein